jgi:bifunctional NMN adenylyltransferase/nudix hydrolase
MKYDLLVFIGRFQPLHLGHQEVIERAISMSKQVLVLVGSANSARTVRNPFTYLERSALINKLYPTVITKPLNDHTYNDTAWVSEVQSHVKAALVPTGKWNANGTADYNIGLIGHNKDHTSYYLKMFPDYTSVSVEHINKLSATPIRNLMYEGVAKNRWEYISVLSLEAFDMISKFQDTEPFLSLKNQYDYLKEYKVKYGKGPFLTADSLVQVGGKILLIERGKEYGHGLFALPGGFVNDCETFKAAALRELKEETNLRVPLPVLQGSIKNRVLFDDPNRSERGRLITECYYILLANDTKLPEVRGGDDADKAFWLNISDLKAEEMFEDHYHIIRSILGLS